MPVTTTADLLQLLVREPGRPRITWYGDEGERVELSGAVLENWVNKTANLLVEEFDAGPRSRVAVDLPAHWRTLVWVLAVWRVGACVVAPAERSGAPDVVVTDRPALWDGQQTLVAVAMPALARSFPGDLPPGAVDAAGAVMTYGDVIGWVPPTDPGAPALERPDAVVRHGDLLRTVVALAGDVPGEASRVLLPAGADREPTAVLQAVAVLAAGGSVVLAGPTVADGLRDDPARRTRLVTSEGVLADLLG